MAISDEQSTLMYVDSISYNHYVMHNIIVSLKSTRRRVQHWYNRNEITSNVDMPQNWHARDIPLRSRNHRKNLIVRNECSLLYFSSRSTDSTSRLISRLDVLIRSLMPKLQGGNQCSRGITKVRQSRACFLQQSPASIQRRRGIGRMQHPERSVRVQAMQAAPDAAECIS